jgi:hypothetical protein
MRGLIRRCTAGSGKLRTWVVPVAAAAIVLAGGSGSVAHAATGSDTPGAPPSSATVHDMSNMGTGKGPNEFGMTMGSYNGSGSTFTYNHGWYCDRHVRAASKSGCEVGSPARVRPSQQSDPLIITVPLGFTAPGLDCPDRLTCVDHPMDIDMTRLATALAPIYKTTPAKLAPALRQFVTPGHDHFIDDENAGKAEWWDVHVVGVTDLATYKDIQSHRSLSYLRGLIKAKDKHVVGPIGTNLFLFFAAR